MPFLQQAGRVLIGTWVGWRAHNGPRIGAALAYYTTFSMAPILGNSSLGSAYGAAGSFVVMLVWIYYSAQLILIGAEFTYAFAHRHDAPITK